MLTNEFYIQLAVLLASEPRTRGSLYIAIGSGLPAWDSNRPPYQRDTAVLENEIARRPVNETDIVFLDEEDQESAEPTARLRVQTIFPAGEGSGTLRECGLYTEADSTPGSGRLISYFIHPRIEKTPEAELERQLVLNFMPGAGAAVATRPTRYLGNARTEELHDLENETAACRIAEIRVDRQHYFNSIEEAQALGYDFCAFCFGRELSER